MKLADIKPGDVLAFEVVYAGTIDAARTITQPGKVLAVTYSRRHGTDGYTWFIEALAAEDQDVPIKARIFDLEDYAEGNNDFEWIFPGFDVRVAFGPGRMQWKYLGGPTR